MKESSRRNLGIALAVAALAGNYSPWVRAAVQLPDALYLSSGQTHVVQTGLPMRAQASDGAVQVIASGDERLGDVALSAESTGEASVTFSLLGMIPVHETKVSVAEERTLIPGGQAVGVALKTQGVLVVANTSRTDAKSALRVGDVILTVQGEQVASAQGLAEQVSAAQADVVELGVLRGGKEISVEASVPVDATDGRRRLGVWVRDSTAGVGTLSYIDPKTQAYGALGHAIVDADTGGMLVAQDGAIMRAQVVGVTRGQSGKAGELKGSFLKENEQIGTLVRNSVYGIYGQMDVTPDGLLYPQGLPVGSRSAVHTGAASIIATVDGEGPKEYGVEIVRCFAQEEPSQKGMILRVTDERLLEKTGGIVQGMWLSDNRDNSKKPLK
ncbi:MAG: SpoIVB peptidase [Clostridia bacterium]|nr:SpoIVB peptidase [Clostridia bacterium]